MTETAGLGRIEKADLRNAWPHEAADFTPWLGDHVSELGAALGLELELQSSEAPVGTLSLDLLARDTGTNRTVIIENQLEPTDHDHLAKLLTYAGGTVRQLPSLYTLRSHILANISCTNIARQARGARSPCTLILFETCGDSRHPILSGLPCQSSLHCFATIA